VATGLVGAVEAGGGAVADADEGEAVQAKTGLVGERGFAETGETGGAGESAERVREAAFKQSMRLRHGPGPTVPGDGGDSKAGM
jgi:hypothetical protein